MVYPAQRLYLETVRRAKHIARDVARALHITGPFNIQFIAKDNDLKVIECNVRASRSFPFVSKVSGHNFIRIATEAMLGKTKPAHYQTLELDHVGVKTPQFSYGRMKGADPVAGVEMASTGEVACIGTTLEEAFFASWQATEQAVDGRTILLSIADEHKFKFVEPALALVHAGWNLYTTPGTHDFLRKHGAASTKVHKISEKRQPSIARAIEKRKVNLVVSIPSSNETSSDAPLIRRLAIDHHIPLMTNAETARLLLRCLTEPELQNPAPRHWGEYVKTSRISD